MKRIAGILVTLTVAVAATQMFADVSIENKGRWPESWPKELNPLREKSRTIEGPLAGFLHYDFLDLTDPITEKRPLHGC